MDLDQIKQYLNQRNKLEFSANIKTYLKDVGSSTVNRTVIIRYGIF